MGTQYINTLICDYIFLKLKCVLLKYVTNKDIFMRYYKIHLSRRLILELVSDQEKEESLINRFRVRPKFDFLF